jgi:general stress protein 26
MKVINANPEIPGMNGMKEIESLLGSKLNLQLATIDETGYPNIQPVWFSYDTDKDRLYILTSDTSKKTHNIRNNFKVYFSVDDCNFPYKGVKGRGNAAILGDPATVISTANKLSMKYYGSLDSQAAKSLIDRSKQQDAVVIEINPKFFSTWDFGKMQST